MSQGTIRFSVGAFNTEEDIDLAVTAVDAIVCGRTTTVSVPITSPLRDCGRARQRATSRLAPAVMPDAIPGLEELWNLSQGDPAICVAILDGPVDLSHPCFAGANLTQWPVSGHDATPNGPAGRHGTKVASLIFGQHHSYVKGIAPRCKGIVIPIFRDGANGAIARAPSPNSRELFRQRLRPEHISSTSAAASSRRPAPHTQSSVTLLRSVSTAEFSSSRQQEIKVAIVCISPGLCPRFWPWVPWTVKVIPKISVIGVMDAKASSLSVRGYELPKLDKIGRARAVPALPHRLSLASPL